MVSGISDANLLNLDAQSLFPDAACAASGSTCQPEKPGHDCPAQARESRQQGCTDFKLKWTPVGNTNACARGLLKSSTRHRRKEQHEDSRMIPYRRSQRQPAPEHYNQDTQKMPGGFMQLTEKRYTHHSQLDSEPQPANDTRSRRHGDSVSQSNMHYRRTATVNCRGASSGKT